MIFVGRWRRESIGWLGVALGAFLLVGCYLVFDVLDLDQSDLYHRLFSSALASQGAWEETERVLQQHLAAPGTHTPGEVSIPALRVSRVIETLPYKPSASGKSQVRRIRQCPHVGRALLAPPTSPDDLPRTIAHAA